MNQAMRRELSILKSADHPNIINLSEVFEDELSVHLVMEYCNGGDLFEHLLKHGTFSENRAGQIVD